VKLSSATIMREGKREIRSIGSACDAACAMWTFCQNSVPNGSCKGFLLLNGKSQNLLNKTLNEDDKIYVQNAARMAQGECNEETRSALVQEVLRFIPHQETRKSGFLGMLEAAHPSNPSTEQTEPEPETRETTGFRAMLSASSKGKKTHNTEPRLVERQNSFDFETQLPFVCSESCPITRHCSSFPSNEGSICVKQTEQFKNKYFVRSEMKDATR